MWLAWLAPLAWVLLMGFVIRRGGSAGRKETLASQSRKNASLLPADEVKNGPHWPSAMLLTMLLPDSRRQIVALQSRIPAKNTLLGLSTLI